MASKKPETTKKDVNSFINRKLQALNTVSGEDRYKSEKAMNRIIAKNKGVVA